MTNIALERKSSIEDEPRTLSFAELQLAREAAIYILDNKPLEEAIKIFTEGLKPVPSISENVHFNDGWDDGLEEEEEEEEDDDEVMMMDCVWMEQLCHACMERNTVTAPF